MKIERYSKIYEKQEKGNHTMALSERTEKRLYKEGYPKGRIKVHIRTLDFKLDDKY